MKRFTQYLFYDRTYHGSLYYHLAGKHSTVISRLQGGHYLSPRATSTQQTCKQEQTNTLPPRTPHPTKQPPPHARAKTDSIILEEPQLAPADTWHHGLDKP